MQMSKKPFSSGIHALVKKGDLFLVMRRSDLDDSEPGVWDLPGGGINWEEQPYEAAIREAHEEAGISIKLLRPLAVYATHFEEEKNQDTWSIETELLADYVSGEVVLSVEHSEYKWLSLEDLKSLEPKGTHLQRAMENLS